MLGRCGVGWLTVKVTPGARESGLGGWQEDVLRIKVREAAEKGRANDAVAKLLAKSLGVSVSDIELKRGATSRSKRFEVAGLTDDEIRRRLNAPML